MSDREKRKRTIKFVPLTEAMSRLIPAPENLDSDEAGKARNMRRMQWCREKLTMLLSHSEWRALEFFLAGWEPERAPQIIGMTPEQVALAVGSAVTICKELRTLPPEVRFKNLLSWMKRLADQLDRGGDKRGLRKWGCCAADALKIGKSRFHFRSELLHKYTEALSEPGKLEALDSAERSELAEVLRKTAAGLSSERAMKWFLNDGSRVRKLLGISRAKVRASCRDLFGRVRSAQPKRDC
ncbi:MAG: hypothetical protein Kow00107_01710 [Planctomycetota bacterium]